MFVTNSSMGEGINKFNPFIAFVSLDSGIDFFVQLDFFAQLDFFV